MDGYGPPKTASFVLYSVMWIIGKFNKMSQKYIQQKGDQDLATASKKQKC